MRKKDENVVIRFNMEEYHEMIKKYWDSSSKSSIQDDILDDLVIKYPSNSLIKDVYAKVTMLNALYSTQIYNTYDVAREICNRKLQNLLDDGDMKAVELIRTHTFYDNDYDFYSFATKYCNLHNREAFPIFDSYVEDVLIFLRNTGKITNFNNKDLRDIKKYKDILETIINNPNSVFYGLSLKEIDRYLWAIGKDQYDHYK